MWVDFKLNPTVATMCVRDCGPASQPVFSDENIELKNICFIIKSCCHVLFSIVHFNFIILTLVGATNVITTKMHT